MEITLDQLQLLLQSQKRLCAAKMQYEWENSEFAKKLEAIAPGLSKGIHEVRDRIGGADFPDDFEVLKKYKVK